MKPPVAVVPWHELEARGQEAAALDQGAAEVAWAAGHGHGHEQGEGEGEGLAAAQVGPAAAHELALALHCSPLPLPTPPSLLFVSSSMPFRRTYPCPANICRRRTSF